MKHVIIAVLSVFIVVIYSIFTSVYVSGFTREIKQETFKTDNSIVSVSDYADNIRRIYDDKNKVLSFILNKEHLENVEEYLICMETSINLDDSNNTQLYKNLFEAAIEDIEKQNNCII